MTTKPIDELVTRAKEKGKLKKWNIKHFTEMDLPDLYLQSGERLSNDQIRFLFFRMKQIKIMQPDKEAKLLIDLIDKSKSQAFVSFILDRFLLSGASAKDKYILCLVGLLGDDGVLEKLKTLFRSLEKRRIKMAQYTIATLALIGSDKALRFIELISLKYQRKISLLAHAEQLFEKAAKEKGKNVYELSDLLIPSFGFEGLSKTIDVNGEEMRVFITNDLKLQFISEKNKIIKSIPKAVIPTLKEELKSIQKEIREVNKIHKERLESYLILERKWTCADWHKKYLNNPVLFIYASTLVWGVFDENQKLKELFYIDESASLLNIEDDEIAISSNHFIGVIHPLYFTLEQKANWNQFFFDLEIDQPFEQLNRPSFVLPPTKRIAVKIKDYEGKKPALTSRGFQAYFEKRNWRKKIGVGSFYYSLTKTFKGKGIYAHLEVEGFSVAWEDDNIVLGAIRFFQVGATGKKKSILLGHLPPIVYSEIKMDLEGLSYRKEK